MNGLLGTIERKLMAWRIPFVRRSGLRVEVAERGHVVCVMPIRPNRNHIGTMYAGALFTLAELPGGILFISSFDRQGFYPIVKDMDIRFLKPAVGDIRIELRMEDSRIKALQAEAHAAGKAEFVLDGELKNAAGEVVATSRGLYQIRKRH